ncbi:MAG: nitrilase-related carbon-nitrogen hydrolase, partial [Cyanobacteriota bacterium]
MNHDRRATHGHALVIDPWGTVLADAGVAPGLAVAPIDLGHVQRVRAQMPSLQHRRPGLF